MEEMCFSRFLKKDSTARIELGKSFHQLGTVTEKVHESDFVPLWDGTVMRCIYMYIYIYIYICVCIYIYIYIYMCYFISM